MAGGSDSPHPASRPPILPHSDPLFASPRCPFPNRRAKELRTESAFNVTPSIVRGMYQFVGEGIQLGLVLFACPQHRHLSGQLPVELAQARKGEQQSLGVPLKAGPFRALPDICGMWIRVSHAAKIHICGEKTNYSPHFLRRIMPCCLCSLLASPPNWNLSTPNWNPHFHYSVNCRNFMINNRINKC